MPSYTSNAKVATFLGTTISISIDDWITAVENWIDHYLGRSFIVEATTRYFDSDGGNVFYVDAFTTLTALTFLLDDGSDDTTLTENTDFYCYPLNETIKNKIVLIPGGERASFPSGYKSIKITASFGGTVPKDIELAATMIVADIYNEVGEGKGVASESLGDYSVSYSDVEGSFNNVSARSLLEKHRIIKL